MKEHPVAELTVIRCNHNYNAWKAVRSEVGWAFAGTFRPFERPTAADAVAAGALSGVPCKTVDITDAACRIAPWDTLPRAMSDAVCAATACGGKVLSLNGYCMLAPAVAGGLMRGLPAGTRLGVVWLDAHYDNVVLETTEAHETTLVGIPLSTLIGATASAWRTTSCKMPEPLPASCLLHADGRVWVPEERESALASGMRIVEESEFADLEQWKRHVTSLADAVDALYVMFDADIMAAEWVPGFYRAEPGGLSREEVLKRVACVMETGKVVAASTWCFDFDREPEAVRANAESQGAVVQEILAGWGFSS